MIAVLALGCLTANRSECLPVARLVVGASAIALGGAEVWRLSKQDAEKQPKKLTEALSKAKNRIVKAFNTDVDSNKITKAKMVLGKVAFASATSAVQITDTVIRNGGQTVIDALPAGIVGGATLGVVKSITLQQEVHKYLSFTKLAELAAEKLVGFVLHG